MINDRTPLGIAISGVCLIIVGMVVKAFLPKLVEVGSFVVTVGWFAIIIGVLWFIITLITGRPKL